MTVDEATLGPIELLSQLQKSEACQNNNLLEILGVVKSTKVSKSSLSAIVRGLYTKNSNLLNVLNKSISEFDAGTATDIEVIKNFVNDFILSLDNNGILLFQKYSAQLKIPQESISFDSKSLCGPLENLVNYINFIDSAIAFLRNPFVLDRLKEIKNELQAIVNDHNHYADSKKLYAIQFDKVRAFGSKKLAELVSSYFTVDQIMERSLNSDLFMQNGSNRTKVELLLLDLANTGTYNSLAILSINLENGIEKSRSLLYPPFRINEVSLVKYKNCFKLKAIDFSLEHPDNNIIIIDCQDEQILNAWVTKLSTIFPVEAINSPVRDKFLLDSQSPAKMFGLGIDLVTDDDHKSALASQESLTSSKPPVLNPQFKELYSPQVSPLGLGPPKILQNRPRIPSEPSSVKSQYDKSLPLIKKTLSDNSAIDDDEKCFQIVNRNTVGVCSEEDRPVSSCAQVVPIDSVQSQFSPNDDVISYSSIDLTDRDTPSNYQPAFASSVPNLGVHNQSSKLYELSTGSAVDINNFGKKYKPKFSSTSDSPDSITNKHKQKRKSIFNIFKKPPKNLETVPGFETVESPTKQKFPVNVKPIKLQADDTIDTTEILLDTEENKPEKSRPASTLPAPFALPSSTSVYFFKKPQANGSTVNVSQSTADSPSSLEVEETTLIIPQDLKDTINNESTVDYYITSDTPKSMKISKWKEKYGKWEMLTVCEKLFVKIVVNYKLGKSWLMVFKEEFDDVYNEEIDKPVLILEVGPSITDIRRSAALDLEINSINGITLEKILINIRCTTGAFVNGLLSNLNSVMLDLSNNVSAKTYGTLKASTFSDSTIASSMMDNPSKSSTMTSLSSIGLRSPKTGNFAIPIDAVHSINALEVYNSCILNNPGSLKVPGILSMTVRLQKQLHSYAKINVPSSWKIVSMFDLKIDRVIDNLTQSNYFHISLRNEDSGEYKYGWLINENCKFEYLEKIGKAGLLVKVSEQEMYMIECKGKREIKKVLEVLG